MKKAHNQMVKQKYLTLYDRLSKAIDTGKFSTYTNAKKQAFFNRLKRYERRLKNWGLTVASAAALFLSPIAASGQSFVLQGQVANNPFNPAAGMLIDVGAYSTPTFVDIDNDGDFDFFIGDFYGNIKYYQNTGSSSSPVFTQQTGINNPLSVDVGYNSAPTCVDIDNDGDFDFFIGDSYGNIKYYQNTGSSSSPVFTQQTGINNPLSVDVGDNSTPTFVDIDNDGDFDAFIGSYDGNIKYYQNTGSSSSPVFTQQTGINNPLSVDVGYNSTPTFVDIDSDGDFDAFIGSYSGTIFYYKNTGNSGTPTFASQTGSSNPFDGVGLLSGVPTFVDIDNQGNLDACIGARNGQIYYFENTSPPPLPVELLDFSGKNDNNVNYLAWQTASEENNEGFDIERSADGKNWETLGFVKGNGTTVEVFNYNFIDKNPINGINYYRLKQMDFDGQFEYSKIVNVNLFSNNNTITIYPNPVRDELTVTNTENVENVAIYNALGQVVKQFAVNAEQLQINVADLQEGIYTLRLQNANGTMITKQFVK